MRTATLILFLLTLLNTRAQDNEPVANQIIKFDFFSPVAGCVGFSYESWYRPGITIEADAGFIGFRTDDYFQADQFLGGFASFGYRFYLSGQEKSDIENYTNFNGFYLKPHLLVNYFNFSDDHQTYNYYEDEFGNWVEEYEEYTIEGTDLSVALLIGFGRQWIFYDRLSIDLWMALGYGGNWRESNADELPEYSYYYDNDNFKYSFLRMDSPLYFDGGLKFGLTLN